MKKENINSDKFIKSLINETGLEQPSHDFTAKIMAQIESEATKPVFEYKPLISRKVWAGLAVAAVAMLAGLLFGYSGRTTQSAPYAPDMDIYLNKISLIFHSISFNNFASPIFIMAFGAFLLLIFFDMLLRTRGKRFVP